MVNFGLGPGAERGEEAAATKKRVTFHCHYSSVLCSRSAEECLHWDGVQGGGMLRWRDEWRRVWRERREGGGDWGGFER